MNNEYTKYTSLVSLGAKIQAAVGHAPEIVTSPGANLGIDHVTGDAVSMREVDLDQLITGEMKMRVKTNMPLETRKR